MTNEQKVEAQAAIDEAANTLEQIANEREKRVVAWIASTGLMPRRKTGSGLLPSEVSR